MTANEWETFRQRLLTLREELLATQAVRDQGTDTVHLDQQSVGRLSRMDALQGQALARAGKQRADQQLREIDAALKRIALEEYGECLQCGEPINPKRLAIDPTTRYCIECAS